MKYLILASAGLMCCPAVASAQHICSNCGQNICVMEQGTPLPGKPRVIPHTDERAGFPRCLSGHASPTDWLALRGYYVGGGTAHGGDAPCSHEGTWGWDDTGSYHFARRVALRWSHGWRFQGGAGAYATDGLHVPDLIAGSRARAQNFMRHAADP